MPLLQLVILALIQGITEFLPISSSAHLILAPVLIESWEDQGPVIDLAAHVGTLLAVLIYFRDETIRILTGMVQTVTGRTGPERTLFLFLLCASIPLVIVGAFLALSGLIDHLRSPLVIGIASIVFGALLWHGDRRSIDHRLRVETMSFRHAMTVGFAQVLALIPGASRSGVTMTAARYLGWSRVEAARFSMLLAIPSIAAGGLFVAYDLLSGSLSDTSPSAAGIVAGLSFISALCVIHLFLRLSRTVSFTPFVLYRILMGVALIAFALLSSP